MPATRLSGRTRLALIAAATLFGFAASGCSLSYQLGGLSPKPSDKTDQTASVRARKASETPAAGRLPPEPDLALAKAALHDVLNRADQETSMPWENPRTGARGTVTPIASAYTQDGQTCRDFLASYVTKTAQSWLQGEACQEGRGGWQVRALKPWKSS